MLTPSRTRGLEQNSLWTELVISSFKRRASGKTKLTIVAILSVHLEILSATNHLQSIFSVKHSWWENPFTVKSFTGFRKEGKSILPMLHFADDSLELKGHFFPVGRVNHAWKIAWINLQIKICNLPGSAGSFIQQNCKNKRKYRWRFHSRCLQELGTTCVS